jgi:superfamily I DNA/RNA helicase
MTSLFAEDQSSLSSSKEKWISHFENFSYNPEQLEFIQYPLMNCKLIGIPGGGKTQSILGKILFHFLREDFQKANHYLLLTFSRKTSLELFHKGTQLFSKLSLEDSFDQFFHRKNIRTIHSIAGTINQEYHMEDSDISSSQDTVIISSMHHMAADAGEKLKGIDELSELKAIFVDEAQDISKIQYEFIMTLSEILHIPILMIGDPNQNIYQFQKGSDTFLLNHSGHSFFLYQNYRSIPSILKLTNHFRPWSQLTPQMVAGREYSDELKKRTPNIFSGSVEEILENVVQKILSSPFPRENIAIIGPVKKSKPIMDTYKNIGLSLFTTKLKEKGIRFKKHYEESMEDAPSLFDIEETSNKEEGYVNLYTIHGAKGLEFDQVFLINFHTTTFGMMPTEEKYREYKYLWYVGMSRAKYQLDIYIDERKIPWNELKMCPNNYYKIEHRGIRYPKTIEWKEEIEPEFFDLKGLMKSKDYFDEEVYYQMEKFFNYKIKKEKIFDIPDRPIRNWKEYQRLYSIFLHFVYIYFYSLSRNQIPDFLQRVHLILENIIFVPKRMAKGFKDIRNRFPSMTREPFLFKHLYEHKNKLNRNEEPVFSFIQNHLQSTTYEEGEKWMERSFVLQMENEVTQFPKKGIEDAVLLLQVHIRDGIYIQRELTGEEIKMQMTQIFQLALLQYQLEEETGHLWKVDFKGELEDLAEWVSKIRDFALEEKMEYEFFPVLEHVHLPIFGEADVISKEDGINKLVSIRFHKNLLKKHIYELCIMTQMMDSGWDRAEIEVWNFYTGERIQILLNWKELDSFLFMRILSSALKKKLKNMIWIYDVEMVGDSLEKADIVQIHMEDFYSKRVYLSTYCAPYGVENIVKYYDSDKLLSREAKNIDEWREDIQLVLDVCEKPLFISHNADLYDQHLFQKEGLFVKGEKVIDTRILLQYYMENKELAKEELYVLFSEIFGYEMDETKCENQVKMLRKLLEHFGIQRNDLLALS